MRGVPHTGREWRRRGTDLAKMQRPLLLYDVAARMWNHVPQMAQRIATLRADRPYLNADELGDLLAFLGVQVLLLIALSSVRTGPADGTPSAR